MQLGLSSAAAPDATVHELIDMCAARGLHALELRAGDAHGIAPGAASSLELATAVASAAAAGVRLAGIRSEAVDTPEELAHLSRALDAPVTVTSGDLAQRIEGAAAIDDAGGRVLVVVRGNADHWHSDIVAAGFDYAWDIDATCTRGASDAAMLLGSSGPGLRYIRMIGGGPETPMQEGRGIGSLMGTLALAGFTGPVILAPSSTRYHVAWSSWLGRRGGWGCGSKSAAADLVSLPDRTATGSTA